MNLRLRSFSYDLSDPLKPEAHETNIYKFNSYLKENKTFLPYEDQVFNVVYGNNSYLFWELYVTHKYTL